MKIKIISAKSFYSLFDTRFSSSKSIFELLIIRKSRKSYSLV